MQRTLVVAGFIGAAMIALAPAAMAGGGIDGTGTVGTCPTAGKIGIKPGLVTGGTAPAQELRAKSPEAARPAKG